MRKVKLLSAGAIFHPRGREAEMRKAFNRVGKVLGRVRKLPFRKCRVRVKRAVLSRRTSKLVALRGSSSALRRKRPSNSRGRGICNYCIRKVFSSPRVSNKFLSTLLGRGNCSPRAMRTMS